MRYELPSLIAIAVLLATSAGAVAGCADESDEKDRARRNGTEAPPPPPGEADGEPSCDETYAGPSASRRLTRFEYDNTIRDLLGDTNAPTSDFPSEEVFYGFDNHATDRGVSLELATQYMYAAEKIAAGVTISKIVPCDATKTDVAQCARQFITTFGKRAYRRPLEPAEIDSLLTTFDAGKAAGGFDSGVRYVIQRMLQSPSFLYRIETNTGGSTADAMIPLSGWELASRLSYFLWGTMPDDALFAAAESNALASKDKVAEQARRMLNDPRAHAVVKKFHRGWLSVDKVDTVVKSSTAYPEFSDAMIPLMKAETERFAEHVVFEGTGDLKSLFTAPYTFANDLLAPLYGVQGVTGSELRKVDLDPSQRAGIFTQLGLMSSMAKANQTSPILRGKFVRTQILCQSMPSAPAGVSLALPEPKDGQSTRERITELTKAQACTGCHTMLDPVGFGFEHYDAIGRWRTDDQGPIDATGEVFGTAVGKFDGAVELASKLAESPEAQTCVARQWFRFQAGRIESKADKCTLQQLDAGFKASGFKVQELLVALTQTDGFLYRAPSP